MWDFWLEQFNEFRDGNSISIFTVFHSEQKFLFILYVNLFVCTIFIQQAEVEKLQTKIKTLLEQHEQEKTELENTRKREVTELKQTLQTVQEEHKKSEEIITQNKENMEKISTDNENIKVSWVLQNGICPSLQCPILSWIIKLDSVEFQVFRSQAEETFFSLFNNTYYEAFWENFHTFMKFLHQKCFCDILQDSGKQFRTFVHKFILHNVNPIKNSFFSPPWCQTSFLCYFSLRRRSWNALWRSWKVRKKGWAVRWARFRPSWSRWRQSMDSWTLSTAQYRHSWKHLPQRRRSSDRRRIRWEPVFDMTSHWDMVTQVTPCPIWGLLTAYISLFYHMQRIHHANYPWVQHKRQMYR